MKFESSPLSVPETDRSVIELELTRLLSERRFSGAPQMSAFLKYIITQTLDGNADRIKAYSVGVDALGKPDSFDAQNDPSVRVLALRLRKTLKAIYATDAPAHAVVELKVGTYVPEFYKYRGPQAGEDTHPTFRSDEVGQAVQNNREQVSACANEPLPESLDNRSETAVMCVAENRESQATQQAAVLNLPIRSAAPDLSLSTSESADEAMDEAGRGYGKVLMLGMLLLLAAIWQISSTRFVTAEAPSVKFASVNPVHLQTPALSSRTGDAASTIPTLYLNPLSDQSNLEQQLSVLLGSTFVRAGTVNVIKPVVASATIDNPLGAYQLILSELPVQGRSRLEAQVVSLDTGEVLMASSLMLDKADEELSVVELSSIESIAHRISSVTGPVYQDYCLRYANGESVECVNG